MGWTSLHRAKGTTNEEWFLDHFDRGTVIHACGTVNNVFYAAVETAREPGRIWAYIALTHWSPKEHFNFSYKDMTETSGPGATEAPTSVLNLLTPTDNPTALEWREACHQNQAQRKALRGMLDGDQVTLVIPLRFTDGTTRDTFTIRRRPTRGKATRAVLTNEWGTTYRVSGWQRMVTTITRDGQTIPTPRKVNAPENDYVNGASELAWGRYSKDPDHAAALAGLNARYGSTDPSAVAHAARTEFREGNTWDELPGLLEAAGLSRTA